MPEIIKLDELIFDPTNARVHPPLNLKHIKNSLLAHGAGRSIVIDGKHQILAGEGTVLQAAELGYKEVLIIDPEPGQIVAVQRDDWTPEQARAYAIADNACSDSSYFDGAQLADNLASLGDVSANDLGYTDDDVLDILGSCEDQPATAVYEPRLSPSIAREEVTEDSVDAARDRLAAHYPDKIRATLARIRSITCPVCQLSFQMR